MLKISSLNDINIQICIHMISRCRVIFPFVIPNNLPLNCCFLNMLFIVFFTSSINKSIAHLDIMLCLVRTRLPNAYLVLWVTIKQKLAKLLAINVQMDFPLGAQDHMRMGNVKVYLTIIFISATSDTLLRKMKFRAIQETTRQKGELVCICMQQYS